MAIVVDTQFQQLHIVVIESQVLIREGIHGAAAIKRIGAYGAGHHFGLAGHLV